MTGPLNGVRVVEICSAISGPFAGKLLGDLGAEVIKIESTGTGAADRTRDLPYDQHGNTEYTWRFLNYNTNKESIAVNLKTDDGKGVLEDLIEESDVLVENMRPGSMERLGFDREVMREINPSLVSCSIKGYGTDGPYTDHPALDTLIQGVSGFATQIGAGDQPQTMEIFVVDMMTGVYATWAITAALFERHSSGLGQHIDVTMLDAAVSMLGHQLAEYTATQHHEDYEGKYESTFAPKGFYATADGYLTLFNSGRRWEELCSAIERPEWAAPDHPYGTNDSRLEMQDELREDLEAIFTERTTDEWMTYFEEIDETVMAAPVNTIEELVEDPQIQAQNSISKRTHPDMNEYYVPNIVPTFTRTDGSLADAPGVADSTDGILERLGYSADERAKLREENVIE